MKTNQYFIQWPIIKNYNGEGSIPSKAAYALGYTEDLLYCNNEDCEFKNTCNRYLNAVHFDSYANGSEGGGCWFNFFPTYHCTTKNNIPNVPSINLGTDLNPEDTEVTGFRIKTISYYDNNKWLKRIYYPQYKMGDEYYNFNEQGQDVTFETHYEAEKYLNDNISVRNDIFVKVKYDNYLIKENGEL